MLMFQSALCLPGFANRQGERLEVTTGLCRWYPLVNVFAMETIGQSHISIKAVASTANWQKLPEGIEHMSIILYIIYNYDISE